MCGIAGAIDLSASRTEEELQTLGDKLNERLANRGPDADGLWVSAAAGVVLTHRRLSILDLSSTGSQPMVSPCGRFVLTFNGEIYNFSTLRNALLSQGYEFRGRSDTEVLLGYIQWRGVREVLPLLNGMFAFGLWDRQERTLTLARDRVGEKPLYYTQVGEWFGFASQLKSLARLPGFYRGLDTQAIEDYLVYTYVPGPSTIYQGTSKLMQGCFLTIDSASGKVEMRRYWDSLSLVETAIRREDENVLLERVECTLAESVKLRCVADVPLGAFLSGGIDSSLIVALMQSHVAHKVNTFTIGCEEWGFDESADAAKIAAHLGTNHTEHIICPGDALALIPGLPQTYDEPFSDPSQIPTLLVSKLARQKVTVCLSGDGGDEIFGGYNRYLFGQRLWSVLRILPVPLRRVLSAGLSALSPSDWNLLLHFLSKFFPRLARQSNFGHKIHKMARIFRAGSPAELYHELISCWPSKVPSSFHFAEGRGRLNFTDWMMLQDFNGYLPDDILTKLDRATMGVGLEGRIPFLDSDVIELGWSLPYSMKIRDGQGKWALRQILYRYVPRHLLDRPKTGFTIPIADWLRGPLRPWAEELLASDRLKSDGYLNATTVRSTWESFLMGRGDEQYRVWTVLMFQAWLDQAPHLR